MAKKNHYHIVLQKEDIDSGLKEHMDGLAAQKKLTARIKTALTLLAQLETGNTEMLDTMFPAIAKKNTPPPPDTSGLEKRLDILQHLLEQGRGNAIPDDAPMVAKEFGSPPKKLAAHTIALPTFDDDDDQDTIVLSARTSSNSETAMAAMRSIAF